MLFWAFILPTFTTVNFYPLLDLGRVSLPGDQMPGVPPVPIPNTAVKPRAANGSRTLGPARVGRCQVMAQFFERRTGPLFLPLTKGRAGRLPERSWIGPRVASS